MTAGDVKAGSVNSAFSVRAVETLGDLSWTHETFAFCEARNPLLGRVGRRTLTK